MWLDSDQSDQAIQQQQLTQHLLKFQSWMEGLIHQNKFYLWYPKDQNQVLDALFKRLSYESND